jgi:hypothetical protein
LGTLELTGEELLDLVETFEDRTENLSYLPCLSERTHCRFHVRRIARRGIRNQFLVLSYEF